jgi:hypothetical protein
MLVDISSLDKRARLTERDQKIPEPIASCRDTHSLCSVSGGVDFSYYSPDNRSPCHGVSCDEETRKGDHSVSDALRRSPIGIFQREMTQGRKY